jgi:hypothetical protein
MKGLFMSNRDDVMSVFADLGMEEWAQEVSSFNMHNRFAPSGLMWGGTNLFKGKTYYFTEPNISVVQSRLDSIHGDLSRICVMSFSGWVDDEVEGYQNIYVKDARVCQQSMSMLAGNYDVFVVLPVVALSKDQLSFPDALEDMQSWLQTRGSGNPTVIYVDTQALDKKTMESCTATLHRYTEEKLK